MYLCACCAFCCVLRILQSSFALCRAPSPLPRFHSTSTKAITKVQHHDIAREEQRDIRPEWSVFACDYHLQCSTRALTSCYVCRESQIISRISQIKSTKIANGKALAICPYIGQLARNFCKASSIISLGKEAVAHCKLLNIAAALNNNDFLRQGWITCAFSLVSKASSSPPCRLATLFLFCFYHCKYPKRPEVFQFLFVQGIVAHMNSPCRTKNALGFPYFMGQVSARSP